MISRRQESYFYGGDQSVLNMFYMIEPTDLKCVIQYRSDFREHPTPSNISEYVKMKSVIIK